MKKITILFIVLLLTAAFMMGDSWKAFEEDDNILDLSIGFSEYTTPFAVGYEHAISPNLGINVSALFLSWGYELGYFGDYTQTLIMPQAHLMYHFTKIKARKLDVYVGAGAGFSIYNTDRSDETATGGLFLTGVVGIRYYVSKSIAIQARETLVVVGDWGGSYTLIGVSFRF
jgi:hypothetical protein